MNGAESLAGFKIFNQQSAIFNLQSAILNLQSAILNRQSSISNPQSAIYNSKSNANVVKSLKIRDKQSFWPNGFLVVSNNIKILSEKFR